jgi:hypothetical protein
MSVHGGVMEHRGDTHAFLELRLGIKPSWKALTFRASGGPVSVFDTRKEAADHPCSDTSLDPDARWICTLRGIRIRGVLATDASIKLPHVPINAGAGFRLGQAQGPYAVIFWTREEDAFPGRILLEGGRHHVSLGIASRF